MSSKCILITAPSLDTKHNVSGISSVTNFIIGNNSAKLYRHFELGRRDDERRNLLWALKLIGTNFKWFAAVVSKKVEVVHFNFALSKASILRDAPLVLIAKLLRKRTIVHLHGGDYLTSKKAPGWMRFVLKRVFSGNIPVIVLSQAEQQAITDQYSVKNVIVLPNCVDLKEAAAFKRMNNTAAPLSLLFIGRISTSKGIDQIYNALCILKKEDLKFKFFMAGAGPEEKEYVAKFTAVLGDDFCFKGVVSGSGKTDLFKACDIFLLPSLFEGLPMSLLETMSFGLVPVVTPVGSMQYVIQNGENGILLQKNPALEMVAAIQKLDAARELVQQLSNNASAYIFSNYNTENYIAALNSLYNAA
jgi:glycosyltransferase involved in cell wall biosynthesis